MSEAREVTRATATNNKWRRHSREGWEAVFARFATSGLGIERFCAREGLSESSFRRWKDLLSDEVRPVLRQGSEGTPEPAGFVDAGTLKLGGSGRLELRLDLGDGVILHLSRG
jgi:hypothetical protein